MKSTSTTTTIPQYDASNISAESSPYERRRIETKAHTHTGDWDCQVSSRVVVVLSVVGAY